MATTILIAQPQTPTTSYSQGQTVTFGRSLSFSSNTTAQDIGASQPTASAKSLLPLNSHMSFTMSQGSQGTGMMLHPSSSFRQYGESNGFHNEPGPQIYSAVYSGVDVYEMDVNNVAVMRRRKDSWLNATQILKVAGVEKGKRTKILEKEILIGEHEKVQGGYGKYQGTWIKFDRGVEFCKQYGVEELLRPLLTYDMGQDGGIAGRGGMDTPTKEQAMAAQRKKFYNSGNETRLTGQSGTFFKNISTTASHAVAAISKARFDSPVPRMRNGSTTQRPSSFSRQSSQQHLDTQESAFPGGSQQSMQSFTSENSYGLNGDSAYATQSQVYSHMASNGDFQEPPRKRVRTTPSVSMSQQTNDAYYGMSMREASPTEPNESFVYHQHAQNISEEDQLPIPLPPLPMPNSQIAEAKRALLMSLFMNPSQTDFRNHEAFLKLSAEDLDMPVDNTAHTALHWAATLARMPLLKALIAAGASIYRVNGGGETPLMRACVVTNNLDIGSFPDLLELLGPTIEIRDGRGRTVLHHIAVTSAVKGRSQASKYYLESLLEFVVRQGSAPNSQTQTFIGNHSAKSMGIGRFMSEIVNAQDKSGDTALNIAARIGNRSIISQLLEVGADAGIPNRAGLRPVDFGIGGPAELTERGPVSPDKALAKTTKENSGDIISSITSLLNETEKEFTTEMAAKQSVIDSIHAQLRESSAQLGDERRRLERLQGRAKERQERKQRINNLRRAHEEEQFRLSQMQAQQGQIPNGELSNMRLGDADKAFLPLPMSNPSSSSLRAHLNAYVSNNNFLESEVRDLQGKSRDLEAKYRRVISLCTKVPENKVDGVLDSLWRAVSSEGEGDVELGRVREFLVKVEGCEA